MAMYGQILKGLTGIYAGREQRKFGREEAKLGEAKYQQQLADFRAGKFDAEVSGEMAKTRADATRLAAQASRRATDRAAGQQQQLLAGAGRGDVRGLAAAAGQARQLEMGAQQAQQAGAQTILGAQQEFGKYSAGVQARNESQRSQLEAMELARGAARFDAGRLTQQEGTQSAIAGGTQVFGSSIDAFEEVAGAFGKQGMRVSLDGVGGPEKKFDNDKLKAKLPDEFKKKLGASREEEQELEELRKKVEELEGSASEDKSKQRQPKDISKMLAILSAPSGRFAQSIGQRQSAGNEFMEEGGYVGEEGGVTEGEFSHEENPIDMVNEEGDKVGEVTGGEFVFNDEQSALMKELIERNEPEMLIKFMRDLLSQPQFK